MSMYERVKLGTGLGCVMVIAPVVVLTTAAVATAFVGVVVMGTAAVAILPIKLPE
jgi:hypothetical protein